jgi:hypothetical protein
MRLPSTTLCQTVVFGRAIAMVLVADLRQDQIHQKAKSVFYKVCIQGFQICHYGLWSNVNFLRPLHAAQSMIVELRKVIMPRLCIG